MQHFRDWTKRAQFAAVSAMLLALSGAPGFAHHPMGGKTPSTFMEGLLSGLGHPVIGPDHFAFIIAIGLAAALVPAGFAVIGAFIAASMGGVLVHAAKLDLPLAEQIVAASVIAAGGLIALGRGGSQPIWLALAAAAGLFHGYAFGEATIGAETRVIGAYLLGIAIIASVIAFAVMQFTRRVLVVDGVPASQLRAAGVVVACVGAVMMAVNLVGA